MADSGMLSAGKLAAKLGVSAGKVKKAIEKAGVTEDEKKGNCKYYGPEAQKKIEAALD